MCNVAAAPEVFLETYGKYVTEVLSPTQGEIKRIFDRWRDPSYWARYRKKSRMPAPSPIQRFHSRIKRPESVVDKILRKQELFLDGFLPISLRKMNDALGSRIVVYFLSNLPLIDHEIRRSGDFEVSSECPPVVYVMDGADIPLNNVKRQAKQSGYASVHYILRLRESALPIADRPWFELQVRTMVEDVWGEIEHILGYKPEKRTSFAVRKQFKILSTLLQSVDEHFNFLFEELSRYQEESAYRDNDFLNAENLPPVLADLGVGCSQREIDGMLKILASRRLVLVADLRRVATLPRIEMIKNTIRSEEGRDPKNFEIVATIATTSDMEEESRLADYVRSQLLFLRAWDGLKDDLKDRRKEA